MIFFWITDIFEEEEADEKRKYAHSIEFFQVVGFKALILVVQS